MNIDEKPSIVNQLYYPPKAQTTTELPKYLFVLTTSTPGTQPVILTPGRDPTSQYSATPV